jgi:cyclic pyranopterin phosphate synthase
MKLEDPYGRVLDNIRLAVTDECNYRCIFCHMEGETDAGPRRPGMGSPPLSAEDYRLIIRAGSILDIHKYKLTGGEPLLRKDIIEIVRNIKEEDATSEISMTTNGFFLAQTAGKLAEVGLSRVNISIHTLRKDKYEFITGVPGLDRALEGLNAALDSGLPVKINMVVLRGVNDNEILEMAEFARGKGSTLQLIELHPVGLGARFFKQYFYPLSRIERMLEDIGAKKSRRSLHNRPIYLLPSGARIEIVRPYANPFFCAGCTRIRIGPYGDILPCLNWRGPRPLITPILHRNDIDDDEKVLLIAETLIDVVTTRKPFYMCTLENCKEPFKDTRRGLRIALPKKARYERAKEELRSLLAPAKDQASTVEWRIR